MASKSLRFGPTGPIAADVQQYPNRVVVSSLSDLPTPVGNVITLETGNLYLLNGRVDVSPNEVVVVTGSYFVGFDVNRDSLVSSTSGTLITWTGTDSLSLANNFTGECPNGSVIGCDVSGVFSLRNFRGIGKKAGTLDCRNFLGSLIQFEVQEGLEFTGNSTVNFLVSLLEMIQVAGGTGPLLDFSTTLWEFIDIVETCFMMQPAGVGISGLANSANLPTATARGVVTASTFKGGSALAGIDNEDLKWLFSSNVGIPDTQTDGDYGMFGNATATTFASPATFVKVAGVTTAGLENRFEMVSDNRMIYRGLEPGRFRIDCSVGAVCGSGNRLGEFQIQINGSGGVVAGIDLNSTRLRTLTFFETMNLTTGDAIEIWCSNVNDTVSITAQNLEVLATRL